MSDTVFLCAEIRVCIGERDGVSADQICAQFLIAVHDITGFSDKVHILRKFIGEGIAYIDFENIIVGKFPVERADDGIAVVDLRVIGKLDAAAHK